MSPHIPKLVAALVLLAVNGLVLAVMLRDGAAADAVLAAALAALVNLAVGVRIGYASARAYADDVARLNRCLSDLNEELVASNRELLERIDVHESADSSPREAPEVSGASAGS